MKKIFSLLLVSILVFTVVGCQNSQNNKQVESDIESIGWSDYIAAGATNVSKAGYCDKAEKGSEMADEYSEKTFGFVAYTICPSCQELSVALFEFDDLPDEKLGDSLISVQQTMICNHCTAKAMMTYEYVASIVLALNK